MPVNCTTCKNWPLELQELNFKHSMSSILVICCQILAEYLGICSYPHSKSLLAASKWRNVQLRRPQPGMSHSPCSDPCTAGHQALGDSQQKHAATVTTRSHPNSDRAAISQPPQEGWINHRGSLIKFLTGINCLSTFL